MLRDRAVVVRDLVVPVAVDARVILDRRDVVADRVHGIAVHAGKVRDHVRDHRFTKA